MRITYPYQTERLGAVRIYGVQHVFELDSDPRTTEGEASWGTTVRHVPSEAIHGIHRQMAVVVPCRDERIRLVEGVLAGIPHSCLLIFVSASSREPVDRFMMERDSVERFCRFTQRSAVIVHQRDPGLARAFEKAGMPELVAGDGALRYGKGEGMIVGMVLAALAGKRYVGFVDSDNYSPGSVNEYIKAYAADFHLAQSRFAMVRISWRAKPKIVDGSLFFNRWGRTSERTNRFLNLLIAYHTGFGTEAIVTGNAGEHALTLDLAFRLRFAGGFAVEPYEFLYLLEQFGGVDPLSDGPLRHPDVMHEGVQIFQVETCNPHFHEDKGAGHVEGMSAVAVNAIFHSPICPPRLQEDIRRSHADDGTEAEISPPPPAYPPLSAVDLDAFLPALAERAATFDQLVQPEGAAADLPIPPS
jgi:mannosyl-3-phosphoglycerate synthase